MNSNRKDNVSINRVSSAGSLTTQQLIVDLMRRRSEIARTRKRPDRDLTEMIVRLAGLKITTLRELVGGTE